MHTSIHIHFQDNNYGIMRVFQSPMHNRQFSDKFSLIHDSFMYAVEHVYFDKFLSLCTDNGFRQRERASIKAMAQSALLHTLKTLTRFRVHKQTSEVICFRCHEIISSKPGFSICNRKFGQFVSYIRTKKCHRKLDIENVHICIIRIKSKHIKHGTRITSEASKHKNMHREGRNLILLLARMPARRLRRTCF